MTGRGALPHTPVKKLFEKSFLTIFKNFYKNHVSHDFLIIIIPEIVRSAISKSFWGFQGVFLQKYPWSPKATYRHATKKSSVSKQTQRTAMPWYHLGSRRKAPPHTRCNRRTWGCLPTDAFRFRGPARKGISHTALYPLSPSVGSLERGWHATSLGHSHFHQLSCIIGAPRPLVKPFCAFSDESSS